MFWRKGTILWKSKANEPDLWCQERLSIKNDLSFEIWKLNRRLLWGSVFLRECKVVQKYKGTKYDACKQWKEAQCGSNMIWRHTVLWLFSARILIWVRFLEIKYRMRKYTPNPGNVGRFYKGQLEGAVKEKTRNGTYKKKKRVLEGSVINSSNCYKVK